MPKKDKVPMTKGAEPEVDEIEALGGVGLREAAVVEALQRSSPLQYERA